eukprot:4905080-Ditylum_brightwellii.AAC.1
MEMRGVLAITDIQNNKEVEKWKQENNIGDMEEKNVVPKYSLFTWNYKLGDNLDRVETTLLAIRAKKKMQYVLNIYCRLHINKKSLIVGYLFPMEYI